MECYALSSSEQDTVALATLLASCSIENCTIYLYSDVGLGKTSFCRGFLRGLGYLGYVKSPSYTLVESYLLKSFTVYHFDFYRVDSLRDLECIGVWDFFNCCAFRLVEWPCLLSDFCFKEDISVYLEYYQSFLVRKITLKSVSVLGKSILQKFLSRGNMLYVKTVKI